jgi:hypothetical protein
MELDFQEFNQEKRFPTKEDFSKSPLFDASKQVMETDRVLCSALRPYEDFLLPKDSRVCRV